MTSAVREERGAPRDGSDALPTVAVVIPTRNRRQLLEAALSALERDGVAAEVIVVDDRSHDGSFEWLCSRAARWSVLRPVRGRGLGAGPARATGVEHATSDVVLFLDDDEIPATGLVAGHARHHRNPGLLVVGYYPTVLPAGASAALRLLARWFEEAATALEAEPESAFARVWGGNLSLHRADAERVPLAVDAFDSRHRHEDREFGIRCHKAGLRCIFDRQLVAEHHYRRSLNQFLADERQSGYGIALLHALHGDVLGPLPSYVFDSPNPTASKFLRVTDQPGLHWAIRHGGVAVTRAADFTGLDRAAERLLAIIARVEKRQGVRDYWSSNGAGEPARG